MRLCVHEAVSSAGLDETAHLFQNLGPARRDEGGAIMSDRARRQVTEWANALLDMSRRNRALHFRKLKRGTLEFVSPSPSAVHTLIAGSKDVQIYHPPAEDLTESPWTLEQCLFE